MSADFSIELQAENINNHKSKEYFKEFLSSYINGNYRSAIVMLWTVTVADIIYKLQDLSEIFKDDSASTILEKIKTMQEQEPTSPKWETELLDLVANKWFLENHELEEIKNLQKKRHICAHPTIKENFELFFPNKETTRAYIRNILEYVLIKTPALSGKKIFDELIIDMGRV